MSAFLPTKKENRCGGEKKWTLDRTKQNNRKKGRKTIVITHKVNGNILRPGFLAKTKKGGAKVTKKNGKLRNLAFQADEIMDTAPKHFLLKLKILIMKKKILGVTFIVTLAAVAAFNINFSKSNVKGDLLLANVEALAQSEIQGIGSGSFSYSSPYNTVNNCTCSSCIKNAHIVISTSQTAVNESGITGGNVGYAGASAGVTGSQGQVVLVTNTVNCNALEGGCCDQSTVGVYYQIIKVS